MKGWYLALHKPGKKNYIKAQFFLSRLNVTVFIPQVYCNQFRLDKLGRKKNLLEPLFPRYMFIYFDPEITHTTKISCCPGLSHLVRFSNVIIPVGGGVVEELILLTASMEKYCGDDVSLNKNECFAQDNECSYLSEKQRQILQGIIEENDWERRISLFHSFIGIGDDK